MPWGDGVQRLPVAPLICAGCAALLVLDLATNAVSELPDDAWDIVRKKNPVLWRNIEEARGAVLAARKEGAKRGIQRVH